MKHDAGGGSPQAGPEARREPADWRAAECRNQAVIYAALAAAGRVIRSAGDPPLPIAGAGWHDLDPHVDSLTQALGSRLGGQPRSPHEVRRAFTTVLAEIDALFDHQDVRASILSGPAWCPGQSIAWWVAAGEQLRAWREAIPRLREEDERRAKDIADRTWSLTSQLRKVVGSEPQQPAAAPGTTRAGRLESLLDVIRKSVGPAEPAFWCAEREGTLRLTTTAFGKRTDGATGDRLGLGTPTPDRRGHLEKLLGVCGLAPVKSEVHAGVDLLGEFRAWRNELATRAEDLLAIPCAVAPGPWPTAESMKDWEVYRVPCETVVPLARPLLADPGGRRPRLVAAGVVLVPEPAVLLDRLREWAGRTAAEGEALDCRLAAAVDSADRIHRGERLTTALFPRPADSRPPLAIIDTLAGLARLLVALEDGIAAADAAAATPPTPTEAVRLAALCEQVWITAGGPETTRRIATPPGAAATRSGGPLALRLKQVDLPVGGPAPPARCPPDVFAAIEDLDWRLWAIHAAASSPDMKVPDAVRRAFQWILKAARHERWEALKTRLLEADGAEALADGFMDLLLLRLRVQHEPSPDEVRAAVIDGMRRLEAALLAHVHAFDPAGLGGLAPPRLASGGIDVFRWRAAAPDGRAATWEVRWRPDASPFGTPLEERIEARKIRVTFSAAAGATEDDVRLLEAPHVTTRPAGTAGTYFAPLHRFGLAVVRPPELPATAPDIAGALAALRGDFAGPDRDAFDGLVKAATCSTPDPDAVHWVGLLRGDPRFGFDCHPPIDGPTGEGAFTIRPAAIADPIAWEDSDDHAAGEDIGIVHALDREHGLRVLSRGRPGPDTPEFLAAALEALGERALPPLLSPARSIRRAIDCCRTFPDERARVVRKLVDALGNALDEVARGPVPTAGGDHAGGDDPDAARIEAHGLLSRIAAHFAHGVLPGNWHPRTGAPAADTPAADTAVVAFHPTVPPGDVFVERFGLAGAHARDGRWRRSVGPAPAGYDSLRTLADAVAGDDDRCRELRRALDDFPGHVRNDKARLAIPGLYEAAWNVLMDRGAAAGDPNAWKQALAELIRRPYDMVMFEPAKLADFPAAWIVGVDGDAPRGRRIVRVVRPGVRTFGNKLVWPAIVETE